MFTPTVLQPVIAIKLPRAMGKTVTRDTYREMPYSLNHRKKAGRYSSNSKPSVTPTPHLGRSQLSLKIEMVMLMNARVSFASVH